MKQTSTLSEKIKQFSYILIPILITQLAMYAMNFFDTMMSGQYAKNDLAGVAIGSSLWVPVYTGLSGILLAVTPIVAQLVGAKKNKEVPFSVIQGIYAGVSLALFVLLIGSLALEPILQSMTLEPEVRSIAKHYLIALSFGIIPLFVFNVLRSFIDALGMTRTTMIITLLTLPINVIFNYLLIFGKLGMPELGGVGSGYASAITYWLVTFIAIMVVHRQKPFNQYHIFKRLYAISFKKWKEIFLLGVPIGMSIFFETSIFSAVTLFMSTFGTEVIAAHQAALNFSSLLYMMPLSISMSLTIVVGFEIGAKRAQDAKAYSKLGLTTSILMSSMSGVILYLFRTPVSTIYSEDTIVIGLIAQFLVYAIFFQFSDAILAPMQGILRGYKDVNVTFFIALISFWVIGLPLGYILANYTAQGPFGYWIGLISGLAAGAIALSFRLFAVQKRKTNEIATAPSDF